MSARKIIPKGPRVLLRLEEEKDMSEGGLYLPETRGQFGAKVRGIILALGTKDCDGLSVGDVVILDKFAGNALPGETDKIILTNVQNLLAVVS